MEGGHAKCFGVRILEIIEASEGVVGETRGHSVNEVGALGVLKNLLGVGEASGVASGLEDVDQLRQCRRACQCTC